MIKYLNEENLSKIPTMFETDDLGINNKDKVIHLHFHADGSHWYTAEYDGDILFYGFVILNHDLQNAEWKNFSLGDILLFHNNPAQIVCDKNWFPVKASSVDLIKEVNKW